MPRSWPGNLNQLHDAYLSFRNASDLLKADLGAGEIARDKIAAPLLLTEDNAGTTQSYVISSVYLADADKYGSPADSRGRDRHRA